MAQEREEVKNVTTIDSRSGLRISVGVAAGMVAAVALAFYTEVRAIYTTIDARHGVLERKIEERSKQRWTSAQQEEFRLWTESEHRRLEQIGGCRQ